MENKAQSLPCFLLKSFLAVSLALYTHVGLTAKSELEVQCTLWPAAPNSTVSRWALEPQREPPLGGQILLPTLDGAIFLGLRSSSWGPPWTPAAGVLKALAKGLNTPHRNRRVGFQMGTVKAQVISHERETPAQVSNSTTLKTWVAVFNTAVSPCSQPEWNQSMLADNLKTTERDTWEVSALLSLCFLQRASWSWSVLRKPTHEFCEPTHTIFLTPQPQTE